MTTTPDPKAEWWFIADVAAHIGVQPRTVSAYLSRGQAQMPKPRMFNRTPAWKPAVIIEWAKSRPGHGGRPPKGD